MTDTNDNVIQFNSSPTCASCGSDRTSTRKETENFEYRHGEELVQLSAEIDVHSCQACGFQFADSSSEDARHEAVCRYLGVMTPAEVKAIRVSYGFTRSQMAEASKIGEASLARWESSALIQTAAYDHFLFLLRYPENLKRLQQRTAAEKAADEQQKPQRNWRSLRGSSLEDKAKQSNVFELRPAAVQV
jgi:putative zinc finger/helix-turn-helix YgiT family protein